MSLEPEFRDATEGMSEEPPGFITNQIAIRRVLTSDDRDVVFVDWPDDAPLLELLGMLEYARTLIWSYYTDEEEEE